MTAEDFGAHNMANSLCGDISIGPAHECGHAWKIIAMPVPSAAFLYSNFAIRRLFLLQMRQAMSFVLFSPVVYVAPQPDAFAP
jgi:hypothetical protein